MITTTCTKTRFQTALLSLLPVAFIVLRWPCAVARADDAKAPQTVRIAGAEYAVIESNDAPEYNLNFTYSKPTSGEYPRLAFSVQGNGDGYLLVLSAKKAQLIRVHDGRGEVLQQATGIYGNGKSGPHVVVERWRYALYVGIDDKLVLKSMDTAYHAGLVGLQGFRGNPDDLAMKFQAVDDIVFGDDFMRTKDEQDLGVWNKVAGDWQFHSVKETNVHADFRLSVNPFSLGGHGKDGALVTTGYSFWNDYRFDASIKSQGATSGIVFDYRGPDDYYLIRWDLTSTQQMPRLIQLYRVTPTGRKLLAGGYTVSGAEQWYRLGVKLRGDRVKVILDGDPIFDVTDEGLLGGAVGLYTEGEAETVFDDVDVHTDDSVAFDYAAAWKDAEPESQGHWAFRKIDEPRLDGQLVRQDLIQNGGQTPRFVVGAATWELPIIETKFRTEGRDVPVSILFGYQDSRNYRVCRWLPANAAADDRLLLIKVVDGKAETYAQSTCGYQSGSWMKLEVDLSNAGQTRIYTDGVLREMVDEPQPVVGRMGLETNGAAPVVFRDTVVKFHKDRDYELPVSNPVFRADPFMLQWSSPQGAWWPVTGQPNSYWHKGTFLSAFTVSMPSVIGHRLTICGDGTDFKSGYVISVTASADGKGKEVTLWRQTEKAASAPIPTASLDAVLTVHKDGEYVWVSANNKDLLIYHDASPLTGRRVGITSSAEVDAASLEARRSDVLDELFEAAPVDWVQYGTWEVTNRFSCTPTWSHMTGISDVSAVLWNKYEFTGDFTIEYYAGMRMQANAMSYPRTGDLNVSFNASDENLGNGYSYLVGAWDPGWTTRWTRLLRGAESVAQTDQYLVPRVRSESGHRAIEVPLIAAGRPVHGAWYYVKVERTGNTINCYFDNQKALTYTDDKPLSGRHFAIWTQDDQIVVARVKITYTHKLAPRRIMAAPPHPTAPLPENGLWLKVDSATNPGFNYGFEDGLDGWKPVSDEGRVQLSLADGPDGRALHVENTHIGGDLAVEAPLPSGLDATRVDRLQFRYRLDPDTKINLYLTLDDKPHFIHMTGPDRSNELMPSLGDLPGVVADGQWHEATFDLAAAVRKLYPAAEKVALTRLVFGQLHEGYLRAGIGGDEKGVTYDLDDVACVTAGPASAAFAWQPPAVPDATKTAIAYAVAVDHSATTVPDAATDKEPAKKLENLADGEYYLHVRAKVGDQGWTKTTHFPFSVSETPLQAERVAPADDAWGGEPLRLQFTPRDGLNLDLSKLKLSVDGKEVATARFDYDWAKRELSIDLNRSGLTFADGQKVKFQLSSARAVGSANTYEWNQTYTTSRDRVPPAAPVLSAQPYRWNFDEDTGSWKTYGSTGAIVTIGRDNPADGTGYLKLVNSRLAGNFGTSLVDGGFNAGKYPLMMFKYRLDEDVHGDFIYNVGGDARALLFADPDDLYLRLGSIGEIKPDDQWHDAQANVRDMIKSETRWAPNQYDVSSLTFFDSGYVGGAPGATISFDDFQFVPAVSGSKGIPLQWDVTDLSGISELRYGWSPSAEALPTTPLDPKTRSRTFNVTYQGLVYFTLRARDAAGNWSPVARYPFFIDNVAPLLGDPVPAPNTKMASDAVTIPLTGGLDSGVDPASVKFEVNGKEYPAAECLTEFDPKTNALTWNWTLGTGLFDGPVADGTQVRFALKQLNDFAGNSATPRPWTYVVDYASDKSGPSAPEIRCAKAAVAQYNTFTYDTGGWSSYYGLNGPRIDRVFDEQKHDYVARMILGSGGSYGAYLRAGAYNAVTYPFISFDYRMNASAPIYLHIYALNEWRSISLTTQSRTYSAIGSVPGLKPDDKWHTATFNLLQILQQAFPGQSSYPVSYIILSNYGGAGQPVYLDNFEIFGAAPSQPEATWSAADPTGIRGYAVAVSTDPDAAPGTTVDTTAKGKIFEALKPGLYYLHVRAQDGAGNWGGTGRFAIYVP